MVVNLLEKNCTLAVSVNVKSYSYAPANSIQLYCWL